MKLVKSQVIRKYHRWKKQDKQIVPWKLDLLITVALLLPPADFFVKRLFSMDGLIIFPPPPPSIVLKCSLPDSQRKSAKHSEWFDYGKRRICSLKKARNCSLNTMQTEVINNLGNNDVMFFCGSQSQVQTATPMPVSSVSGLCKRLPHVACGEKAQHRLTTLLCREENRGNSTNQEHAQH